jgi:hypothetical protein
MPTPAIMFAWIVFGAIGFAAFVYGKRLLQVKTMLIAVALMVYPYFVSDTWVVYAIGIALCVALFLFRG